MAEYIVMPKLGFDMREGVLVELMNDDNVWRTRPRPSSGHRGTG